MQRTFAPNVFSQGLSSLNSADDYYKIKTARAKAKVAATKDKSKPNRASKPKGDNSELSVVPPKHLLLGNVPRTGHIENLGGDSQAFMEMSPPPFWAELDDLDAVMILQGTEQFPLRNCSGASPEGTSPTMSAVPKLDSMTSLGCEETSSPAVADTVVLPCWLGELGDPQNTRKHRCDEPKARPETKTLHATSYDPPRCPRGSCLMSWTRHAVYLAYFCSGCRKDLQGARWHCADHKEDYCGDCKAAPPNAAFSGGSCDIVDDHTVKGQRPVPKSRVRDALAEMLAAQEELIQQRRLDRLTNIEAAESRRGTQISRPSRAAAAEQESESPAQRAQAELDANLMDENAARDCPSVLARAGLPRARGESSTPLTRTVDLTAVLAGDLLDELARGYSQPWFQELLRDCARECSRDRLAFLARLQDVAVAVQRPILENWGFEDGEQGIFDLTSIMRQYDHAAPSWLRAKRDRCLELLFGACAG